MHAVSISDAALARITREAARSLDGLETGGILLGTDTANAIVIRHAGAPGPHAQRSERSFLRDLDHARQLAQSAWLEDGSQWIGDWHTHPTGETTPSGVDLHAYLRHLRDPDLQFDRFVAIIAGLGASACVNISTWLIEPQQCRRVPLAPLSSHAPANSTTVAKPSGKPAPRHSCKELP